MIPDQPVYREYYKKSPGIEFNRVKSQHPGSTTGPAKPSPTSLKDRRNYFFESFHPFYAALDAALGRSRPRPPFASLQSEAHGKTIVVLLDSVVDIVRDVANDAWWQDSWAVSRGAEDGIPSASSLWKGSY